MEQLAEEPHLSKSAFSRYEGQGKDISRCARTATRKRLKKLGENPDLPKHPTPQRGENQRKVKKEWTAMKYLIDFAALALLYAFVFFRKWRRKGNGMLLVNTLMYVYLSFVLYFTLMPVITSIPSVLNHPYTPMNLVPFVDVLEGRGDFLRQVILNVMMTVPFGFLFPLTQKGNGKFLRTVFFCFLMSFGIEILQPLINDYRSSDITDLITNVAGGMAGYALFVIFKPVTFWILDRLKLRKRAAER